MTKLKTKNLEKYGYALVPADEHHFTHIVKKDAPSDTFIVFPIQDELEDLFIEVLDKDTVVISKNVDTYGRVMVYGSIKKLVAKGYARVDYADNPTPGVHYEIIGMDSAKLDLEFWLEPEKLTLELYGKADAVIRNTRLGVNPVELYLQDNSLCIIYYVIQENIIANIYDTAKLKINNIPRDLPDDKQITINAYDSSTIRYPILKRQFINFNMFDNSTHRHLVN